MGEMNRQITLQGLLLAVTLSVSGNVLAGTLFIAADTEDFANSLPDRLGVWNVTGPTVNSSTIINTDFFLNGLADAGGKLLTGTPNVNTLRYVGFDGTDLGSFAASGILNGPCCNEEMLFVPQPVGPAKIYHANYSLQIVEIDLAGNLVQSFDQTDVVGMALAGTDIWISKWGGREVGTWNPLTNTFTSVFSTPDNAGGLAYDPVNDIMWVGMQGGTVTPYSLTGAVLGASFQPFGDIPDTIDGLTFLGEVTNVPEPATVALLSLAVVGLGYQRRRKALKA
jgi:hypothetical protein